MTNVKVIDKAIPNELMEEKNIHVQTMYNVEIPANTLTQGSKLRITSTISKGGGSIVPTKETFKSSRVFCSLSNQQAVIGETDQNEVFDPVQYMGGVDGENRVIHLTSSIDGYPTAGVCYTRTCCPVFVSDAALAAYAADPDIINTYPASGTIIDSEGIYGVLNAVPGGEYGPACNYMEVWFKLNKILEGNPVIGSMVYIRPGSTIQNMTGYGFIYDSKYNKVSVRMWKNQSMLTYAGHKLFEVDYTMEEGSYLYAVIDASYFSFDPVWLADLGSTRYPYIYLYVEDFTGNVILEKIWSPRLAEGATSWYGTSNTAFNVAFDQLLGPEHDMYTGLCVLGENVSGHCMSKAEIQEFNMICGLCYNVTYNTDTLRRQTILDLSCTNWPWGAD